MFNLFFVFGSDGFEIDRFVMFSDANDLAERRGDATISVRQCIDGREVFEPIRTYVGGVITFDATL